MHTILCPLCGSDSRTVLVRGSDLLHGVPGDFSVTRCSCGLVYINPQPDNDELQLYYPDHYLAHKELHGMTRFQRHRALKEFVLRWYYDYPLGGQLPPRWQRRLVRPLLWLLSLGTLKSAIPYHGGGRLLDIGCGNGGWLRGMQECGWTVQGVEIDENAARTANAAGVPTFCGTLPAARFPDQSFDVVRLHYVFEHLINPAEILNEIRRILKTDGVCYIRVPNIASCTYRWFKQYWYPLDVPRHVFHYTPDTFTRLARQNGLAVQRVKYYSPPSGFFVSLEFMRREGALPAWLRPVNGERAFWRNLWRPLGWLIDRAGQGDIVEFTLVSNAAR